MRWRVRIAFAVVPLGCVMLGDLPAILIALLSAGTTVLICVAGSWLARQEMRVERMHWSVRRWR